MADPGVHGNGQGGKGMPGCNLDLLLGARAAPQTHSPPLSGTGKSSIVCALCLGLGGSTSLLGRAKDVSMPVWYSGKN